MKAPDDLARLTRRAAARRGGNAVIAEMAAHHLVALDRVVQRIEDRKIPSDRMIRAARKAHTSLVHLLTAPIDPTGAGD